MNNTQDIIKNIVSTYNKINRTKFRTNNAETIDAITKVIQFCGDEEFYNGNINNYLIFNKGQFTDISDAMYTYIEKIKEEVEKKKAKEKELDDISDDISKELQTRTQLSNTIGLLEKTLAETILKDRGENMANEVMKLTQQKVDDYIHDTYGTIKQKIELTVNEHTVELEEKTHKKFETILKYVNAKEPVFLVGKAGTGKNVICKQIAKALGLNFYFSNAVTQEYKLTGFTDAMGKFHETQFYKAFKNGGLFMLDEIDASIPEVLIILNAAIANGYFDFPAPIGYVEAHKDFRLVAAGNTFGLGADYDYVGRNQLDAASLDRFALVKVDYDDDIALSLCDKDTKLVEFANKFRAAAEKGGIRAVVSYRAIKRIFEMSKVLELTEVLEECLLKNMQKDDLSVIIDNMGEHEQNKYTNCLHAIYENM